MAAIFSGACPRGVSICDRTPYRICRVPMRRERGMEVNLGLALGQLTSATRQKNNLGLDRFNLKDSTIGGVDLRSSVASRYWLCHA